jgi:hypothetical protein
MLLSLVIQNESNVNFFHNIIQNRSNYAKIR